MANSKIEICLKCLSFGNMRSHNCKLFDGANTSRHTFKLGGLKINSPVLGGKILRIPWPTEKTDIRLTRNCMDVQNAKHSWYNWITLYIICMQHVLYTAARAVQSFDSFGRAILSYSLLPGISASDVYGRRSKSKLFRRNYWHEASFFYVFFLRFS